MQQMLLKSCKGTNFAKNVDFTEPEKTGAGVRKFVLQLALQLCGIQG